MSTKYFCLYCRKSFLSHTDIAKFPGSEDPLWAVCRSCADANQKQKDPRYLQLRISGFEVTLVVDDIEFSLRSARPSREEQESFRDSIGVLRRALKMAGKSTIGDDLPFSVFIREG